MHNYDIFIFIFLGKKKLSSEKNPKKFKKLNAQKIHSILSKKV